MSNDERYGKLLDLGEMTAPPLSEDGADVVSEANEILRRSVEPLWQKAGNIAMSAVTRYGAYLAAMTPAGCAQSLAEDYNRRRNT